MNKMLNVSNELIIDNFAGGGYFCGWRMAE
ncbi:conserved hypothetical protein [Carnobacterium maltaromaticum]|nr:conserved hypothetical protein [Carnobacterium maltaromaticum]